MSQNLMHNLLLLLLLSIFFVNRYYADLLRLLREKIKQIRRVKLTRRENSESSKEYKQHNRMVIGHITLKEGRKCFI